MYHHDPMIDGHVAAVVAVEDVQRQVAVADVDGAAVGGAEVIALGGVVDGRARVPEAVGADGSKRIGVTARRDRQQPNLKKTEGKHRRTPSHQTPPHVVAGTRPEGIRQSK